MFVADNGLLGFCRCYSYEREIHMFVADNGLLGFCNENTHKQNTA